MTIQNLINDLQQCSNSQAVVNFHALFDIGAYSSAQDFEKEILLKFNDCEVLQDHPCKVTIKLT